MAGKAQRTSPVAHPLEFIVRIAVGLVAGSTLYFSLLVQHVHTNGMAERSNMGSVVKSGISSHQRRIINE